MYRMLEVVTSCTKHNAERTVQVLLECKLTSVVQKFIVVFRHMGLCVPWCLCLCHRGWKVNARCGVDSTWVVDEPLGAIQCGFCWPGEELLACQEGLFSTFLVSPSVIWLIGWRKSRRSAPPSVGPRRSKPPYFSPYHQLHIYHSYAVSSCVGRSKSARIVSLITTLGGGGVGLCDVGANFCQV